MPTIDSFASEIKTAPGLCIRDLIKAETEKAPDAAAISAPGRLPMTYRGLTDQIDRIVKTLNMLGLGSNDRLAMVVHNGPEAAVSFLSLSACAVCAPLNPAYRANEFDFFLKDLNAKALVILNGFESPARAVAHAQGIPVIELTPSMNEAAGVFKLHGRDEKNKPKNGGYSRPEDVALLLHTSGTTSRPKIVPLTHANLMSSAKNIKKGLYLTTDDCCLNIMPLFHIHGLVGAVLSSIVAGACVVCSPGFSETDFFDQLNEFRPTWYTAVPTMHQAILLRATALGGLRQPSSLRFIRSCSSPLPPNTYKELEKFFQIPVIEAYGMTEASHQMASNPLPPKKRKIGSVGLPVGNRVSIMDDVGNILAMDEIGEIVIQGDNVTEGYENNPEANQGGFTNGWFRTGDQGYLDAEGYLFLTGRIKELINRGGEKIAPREIDEALMTHPAVVQAVTFAVPHPTIGEDITAAVIIGENEAISEMDLREYAFERLADFKVPSRIIIVDEIPKGPTGKLQRIGLGEKFAPLLKSEYVEPQTASEQVLANIWKDVLNMDRVGIYDNFFYLGGDSLMAVKMVSKISAAFSMEISLETIFRKPTVSEQSKVIEEMLFDELGELSEDEARRLID